MIIIALTDQWSVLWCQFIGVWILIIGTVDKIIITNNYHLKPYQMKTLLSILKKVYKAILKFKLLAIKETHFIRRNRI